MAVKPNETMRDVAKEVLERKAGAEPADRATGTEVATIDLGATAFYIDRSAIKVKKLITVPVLRFPSGSELCIRFGTPIKIGKELAEGKGGKPKMAPAEVATVQAMDGSIRQLVCGTVLAGNLRMEYPDDSYVGLWFYIKKFAPDEARGKDYSTYEIMEIFDPRPLNVAAEQDRATIA